MPGGRGTKSEGKTIIVEFQANASPRDAGSTSGKQQGRHQIRHRASVACASCRDRRIRCVVPQGKAECTQCRRAGTECIIKNDDERRRPISKAYMCSLSARIAMLEGMLEEQGIAPPPASHPPKTKHGRPDDSTEPPHKKRSIDGSYRDSQSSPSCRAASLGNNVPSPPDSRNGEFVKHEPDLVISMASIDEMEPNQQLQLSQPSPDVGQFRLDTPGPGQDDLVHRLLSNKGNLSFDQLSGQLRFFGSTANSHVYAQYPEKLDFRESTEDAGRAERIICSLGVPTHDYLMENFWEHYNAVIRVIDQEAFESDRVSRQPKYYTQFLHICMLAMGYRASDKTRDDMKRISLGNRESVLHREAKRMLDNELERPGGIPSVQALLLLGDLECGVGRDNTGWMYSGMANRLAFDIGLHLDCRENGVMEPEASARRMVMRAAVIYDKYWALFLGRPTSIKKEDISMELLSDRFSSLTSSHLPSKLGQSMVAEIYDQLFELMDLAGRIVETRDNRDVGNRTADSNFSSPAEVEENAYRHVVDLGRQLQNWYRRLPDHLAWKPANIKTAPYSFFLLHQQYHVSMILLHRPWAKYDAANDSSVGFGVGSYPSPGMNQLGEACTRSIMMNDVDIIGPGSPYCADPDGRAALSRRICTQQAIRVSRIFWQHRQRFDGRKIFVTGIQHAGTSALALMAAIALQKTEEDRRTYMGYLEILSDVLKDMGHTYHPATRMDHLLKLVLKQIRNGLGQDSKVTTDSRGLFSPGLSSSFLAPGSWTPLRCETSNALLGEAPAKRKRPGGASIRRASEFARPPPPFFTPQTPSSPAAHRQQQRHIFGYQVNHQRHRSHVDSISIPGGSNAGGFHGFDLGFLDDAAADIDIGAGDCLMTPSSDIWSLGAWPASQNDAHQGGLAALEDAFAEGPAALGAGSLLGHNYEETGIRTDWSEFESRSVPMTDADVAGGTSPFSMDNLMQTAEKRVCSLPGRTDDVTPRNRDLDFFSFT